MIVMMLFYWKRQTMIRRTWWMAWGNKNNVPSTLLLYSGIKIQYTAIHNYRPKLVTSIIMFSYMILLHVIAKLYRVQLQSCLFLFQCLFQCLTKLCLGHWLSRRPPLSVVQSFWSPFFTYRIIPGVFFCEVFLLLALSDSLWPENFPYRLKIYQTNSQAGTNVSLKQRDPHIIKFSTFC